MGHLDPIAEARRKWVDHGWQSAATGMAAVTSIVRVNQILTSRIDERLEPLGLTFARFEVLRLLGFTQTGSLPMGKIGERLQVHPASVTNAVKRLEADRLLARSVSPADNRMVIATLLPRGRQVLEEATATVNEVFERLGAPDADLESLLDVLAAIRESAGDFVEPPV